MSQELMTVNRAAAPRSLFNMQPQEMVDYASSVANVLKNVIDKQHLYSTIGNKKGASNKYVKVEGWCTLGTILGILPQEEWVKEHHDGSFEAMVKLVRQSDGMVVGGASALCGKDEHSWGNRERFARRSMAITRATGKAYRLGFAWIMSLAGYETTPAEEMPHDHSHDEVYQGKDWQKKEIAGALAAMNIPRDDWATFSKAFEGSPMSLLEKAIHKFKVEKDRKHEASAYANGNGSSHQSYEADPSSQTAPETESDGVSDIMG